MRFILNGDRVVADRSNLTESVCSFSSQNNRHLLLYKVVLQKSIPAKFVKLFFASDIIKNKFTDLCGNRLLQNNFLNTLCEIRPRVPVSVSPARCQANAAHIRQSSPDSGLGL